MTVGEIIAQRRKELGLTLEDIGKAVGVGKSTVKKWESGYISNMKRDKIALLANVLQISPSALIGSDAASVPPAVSTDDEELIELLEELKTRPEMRMLFSLSKNATKEDVEDAVRIIEALRKGRQS